MHQHTVALRLHKSIGYFELEHPGRVTHNFTRERWTQLAEIQGIETVSGSLTMRCQEESKATAGFWYTWLNDAFAKLSGLEPFPIIDTPNVTESHRLPYIERPLATFTSLAHIVRGRHMVEFKRRYGLEGLATGLDVDHTWSPTMTQAWGLPILMDPRLCGIPGKWVWFLRNLRTTKTFCTNTITTGTFALGSTTSPVCALFTKRTWRGNRH